MQRQLLDMRMMRTASVRHDKADVSRIFQARTEQKDHDDDAKASTLDVSVVEPTKEYDKPWVQSPKKKPGTIVAYSGNLPDIRKRKGGSVCTVSHRFNLDIIKGDAKKYDMLRTKEK